MTSDALINFALNGESGPSSGTLEALRRREEAAAERLAEIEMMLQELGGGAGAELIAVEQTIDQRREDLRVMEEQLAQAKTRLSRVNHRQRLEAESELKLDALRRQTADAEAALHRLRGLTAGYAAPQTFPAILEAFEQEENPGPDAPPEKFLAVSLRLMKLLDALDAQEAGGFPASERNVLRNRIAGVLSGYGIHEFALHSGAGLANGLAELARTAGGRMPGEAAVVQETLQPGFAICREDRPPVMLRPAIITVQSTPS